jgi:hypothetical protein
LISSRCDLDHKGWCFAVKQRLILIFILGFSFLVGCSKEINPTPSPTGISILFITPTLTATPTLDPTQTSTTTALPTATPIIAQEFCSPLAGIEKTELHAITSNPYIKPKAFVESGHPAIDFAFYQYKQFTTFSYFPLQSILPGKIAFISNNKFPYGNMVIIETPLGEIESNLLQSINLPTPYPPGTYSIDFVCPVVGNPIQRDQSSKSVYVLYAHMAEPVNFSIGDQVGCGQSIGFAGKTGNSAEDHVHIEIRVGPSHVLFESIASYNEDASKEERYNYCIWALSGVFQPVDPALILDPPQR